MHPFASRPSRCRGGSESERQGWMLVTGWRSRESLSAARRGESDMANAVQKITLSRPRATFPSTSLCSASRTSAA